MINKIKLYHLRKKAALPDCIIVNNNFSVKLNVWGGISKRGPTPFVTFNNNMNRFGYQEILIRHLWPFIIQRYQGRCYVHQDNDPKHTSRLCMSTCFRYGINLVSELNFYFYINELLRSVAVLYGKIGYVTLK
jgi:hypothetical protein